MVELWVVKTISYDYTDRTIGLLISQYSQCVPFTFNLNFVPEIDLINVVLLIGFVIAHLFWFVF